MTDYEIFILVLCLIVFVLLAGLSAICLTIMVRQDKRLIACGESDEKLIKEYKRLNKCCSKTGDVIAMAFNIIICIVFVAVLIFSLYINTQDSAVSDTIPTLRVVESDSMSEKNAANTYLYENGLDNQFDTFDLIYTYKMPDEYALELYDIVVYEYKDTLIIHRIVAIEEPNDTHPDCRWFTLRGDANEYSDSTSVLYTQMKGIYTGERIRFLGSFVLFMQSPAGWLCVALIVAVVFISPAIEKYIGKKKYRRLVEIGVIDDPALLYEIEQEKFNKQTTANYVVPPLAPAANVNNAGVRRVVTYSGNGFYDLVELYPDLTYRTVKTETEQRGQKTATYDRNTARKGGKSADTARQRRKKK